MISFISKFHLWISLINFTTDFHFNFKNIEDCDLDIRRHNSTMKSLKKFPNSEYEGKSCNILARSIFVYVQFKSLSSKFELQLNCILQPV